MLAKVTSNNRLTLPKAIRSQFPGVDYFQVSAERGQITLKPFRKSRIEEIRDHIDKLGISEKGIEDAIRWVRRES